MTREDMIEEIEIIMHNRSNLDIWTLEILAVEVVDKFIIPLRDDIQAACDQALRATEKQAECNCGSFW